MMLYNNNIQLAFELNDDIQTPYLSMHNACCRCWLYRIIVTNVTIKCSHFAGNDKCTF